MCCPELLSNLNGDGLETALVEGNVVADHAAQTVNDTAVRNGARRVEVSVDLDGRRQREDQAALGSKCARTRYYVYMSLDPYPP